MLENVKGLLSHDNGNTFKTIISTLDELGYDLQWQVLNSKNHGVPQNRERVFIIGHLRGTSRPEVFPITSDYGETSNEVTHKGHIVDLTRREPTSYRERTDGRAGTLDANYYKGLVSDFKSIAASGWGPELIPDEDILQSQFPQVLAELETQHARLAELQALFAAASEEDFEDSDDTGVLPADEVKTLKDELKEANAEWKAQLKTLKGAVGDLFSEIKLAGLLPKGTDKAHHCSDGFTAKEAQFANGQRVLDLSASVGHTSTFASVIEAAMAAGQQAKATAERIEAKLATHKALEDEAKALKAAIKSTEAKKDELVEQARLKISKDEARQVIVERLGKLLFESYRQYLRADQRACVAAVENLWGKYAVTAKQIEAERDEAAKALQDFLVELGYE